MLHESWIIAFSITVLVEVLVAAIWAKCARMQLPFLEILVLNLVTHPLAFVLASNDVEFVPIEIGVILIEVCGLRLATRLSWNQAILLGLLCNVATLSLSFL